MRPIIHPFILILWAEEIKNQRKEKYSGGLLERRALPSQRNILRKHQPRLDRGLPYGASLSIFQADTPAGLLYSILS